MCKNLMYKVFSDKKFVEALTSPSGVITAIETETLSLILLTFSDDIRPTDCAIN